MRKVRRIIAGTVLAVVGLYFGDILVSIVRSNAQVQFRMQAQSYLDSLCEGYAEELSGEAKLERRKLALIEDRLNQLWSKKFGPGRLYIIEQVESSDHYSGVYFVYAGNASNRERDSRFLHVVG